MTTTRRETEKKNYCMHVRLYVKCHKLRDIFTIMNFSRASESNKNKTEIIVNPIFMPHSFLFDQFLTIQLFLCVCVCVSEEREKKCITRWFMELVSVSVWCPSVYMKKSHRTVINKAVLILTEWVLWFMIACNVFDHFETQTTTTAATWWWRLLKI